MRSVLIDSGPLIALFAVDDKHHQRFDRLITNLSKAALRLITTWPCIVESAYLLDAPQRFEMLHWIELGGAQVCPFEPYHLGDMLAWMERYTESNKREMDLADASLYWLAAETGIVEILTIDHNDFERYRLPDGQAFVLLN